MREPWSTALESGDPEAAWELLLERYRRLIFGAIRHYVRDHDDVMDVFARVCAALHANDFARLRRYLAEPDHRARFSTWLVAVVHNQTIDWLRHRDGRGRLPIPPIPLAPLRQQIFELVFLKHRTHAETFELLRARARPDLSFHEFAGELRETYRAVRTARPHWLLAGLTAPGPEPGPDRQDPAEVEERTGLLARALESLPPDDHLVVQLYVVEEMAAGEVARIVGLPNAKAVYNRVYRSLAAIRARLAAARISPGDL